MKILEPLRNSVKKMYRLKPLFKSVSTQGKTLREYILDDEGYIFEAISAGVHNKKPFNGDGIPLVDYGPGIGVATNPVTTCQVALSRWGAWCREGNQSELQEFRKLADFLVETQEFDGKWLYNVELKHRGVVAPWCSGMAQGQALSVLSRAFQEFGDEKYLESARRAFTVIDTPLEEGGVLVRMEGGGIFYEEYPNPNTPSHVLNGHVFTLFGLFDFFRVSGILEANESFENGVKGLRGVIGNYAAVNGWSYYQLQPRYYVTHDYMMIHVLQLDALYQLTGDQLFSDYARKWEGVSFPWWSMPGTVIRGYQSAFRRNLRR